MYTQIVKKVTVTQTSNGNIQTQTVTRNGQPFAGLFLSKTNKVTFITTGIIVMVIVGVIGLITMILLGLSINGSVMGSAFVALIVAVILLIIVSVVSKTTN